jgi:hypothetical protein
MEECTILDPAGTQNPTHQSSRLCSELIQLIILLAAGKLNAGA